MCAAFGLLMILEILAHVSIDGARPSRNSKINDGSPMIRRPKVAGAIEFASRNFSISARNSAAVCIGIDLLLFSTDYKHKKIAPPLRVGRVAEEDLNYFFPKFFSGG